jgi:hypothetical protein
MAQAPAGSLSEYAHERATLRDLLGAVHPPGDLADLGPPRAKVWACPDDNPRVAHGRPDPRFGVAHGEGGDRSGGPMHDLRFGLVRPRTTGWGAGHIRGLSTGPLSNETSPAAAAASADTAGEPLVPAGWAGLAESAALSAHSCQRRAGSNAGPASTGEGRGERAATPDVKAAPMSSTGRRLQYTNEVHGAVQARHDRDSARLRDVVEGRLARVLAAEVSGGIDDFEQNLLERKASGWRGV